MLPTQKEIIEHVRDHFGISGKQVLQIMQAPTHPSELRDEFAAKSITAMLAPNPVTGQFAQESDFEQCAVLAYKMADAMLKARSEK